MVSFISGAKASSDHRIHDVRSETAAAQAATATDGSVTQIAGLLYRADSSATGSNSAANDLGVQGLVPFGIPTPYHFGAVGDGVADDTAALQAFFDYAQRLPEGSHLDFSGRWGVSDTVTIDLNGVERQTFACGSIEYLGGSDLAMLVYLDDVGFCNFTGKFSVIGSGGTTYATREVTDLIVANQIEGARFDGIFARYAKRHGLDLGGLPGDTPKHIGLDIGRCFFKECGSAVYNIDGSNVRLKEYNFTTRSDSGGVTSTTQRSMLTIEGGTDVLQEGGILKFNNRYHWIESVDSGAGTITVYPLLSNTDTTGTFQSSHGAAVRNWGANSASMRIGGLKALGCGVGLDNECLYGPHVSNLETQVVGVSYKQKGLCYGTVIDTFHPETPDGDVDILKCDGFGSRTTFTGPSVYRGEDIINLFPTDPATGNETTTAMLGVSINPGAVPVAAGQKTHSTQRLTSLTLKNSGDTDPVVVRNRTTTTISLERDQEIARLFGCTTISIMRVGDSTNLVPGDTTIQPTFAEASVGVTVMGGASYMLPALPEGTTILCELDVPRQDWRVYTTAPLIPQDAPADPTGGATVDIEARAAIVAIIERLQSSGTFL